jgi:hypothetical protein
MCKRHVVISSSREWWVNSYWMDFNVVGGIVNLDKEEAWHAMLGIVVALYALHNYRIKYQPLSPKPIPRRLFKLSFSFHASWDGQRLSEIQPPRKCFKVSPPGRIGCCSKDGLVIRRGGSTGEWIMWTHQTKHNHERLRNVLCAWKSVTMEKDDSQSTGTKEHERASSYMEA